jgi:hypothetical protein
MLAITRALAATARKDAIHPRFRRPPEAEGAS